MKKIFLTIFLLTYSVFSEGIIPNKSEEIVGIKEEVIISFLERLKKAIKEDDKKVVVDLVSFPFKQFQKGKVIKTFTKKSFLKHYEIIMNKKVKQAIINQKPKELFINSKGVMIGTGEVWFSSVLIEKHYQIKIIAIN